MLRVLVNREGAEEPAVVVYLLGKSVSEFNSSESEHDEEFVEVMQVYMHTIMLHHNNYNYRESFKYATS